MAAPALATARETPRMALAPSLALFSVPSSSIMVLSMADWCVSSRPMSLGAMIVFTLPTAVSTPLPM